MLTSGYLASPMNPGMGGYAFAYQDMGGSTASASMTQLCGCGTDVAQNPPSYSYYGGGLGVNLNQMMATSATPPAMGAIAQSGTGVTYAVTSIPANGLRLQVVDATTQYCAVLTAKSGMIPWSMFNTKCYDTTPDGTALPASDMITQIEFGVPSNGTAGAAWDFCVTALSF